MELNYYENRVVKILKEVKKGNATLYDIARKYKLSYETILRYCKRAGITNYKKLPGGTGRVDWEKVKKSL